MNAWIAGVPFHYLVTFIRKFQDSLGSVFLSVRLLFFGDVMDDTEHVQGVPVRIPVHNLSPGMKSRSNGRLGLAAGIRCPKRPVPLYGRHPFF